MYNTINPKKMKMKALKTKMMKYKYITLMFLQMLKKINRE